MLKRETRGPRRFVAPKVMLIGAVHRRGNDARATFQLKRFLAGKRGSKVFLNAR